MMNLKEYKELIKVLQNPPKSAKQVNSLFTSDVEILKLKKKSFFSITTDSISDEISWGLYKDPETWGWMAVQASISDLAAASIIPKGLVINSLWKSNTPIKTKILCQKGINKALRTTKTPLLGGDMGVSNDPSFTSTAFGFSTYKPLTRVGAQIGDLLCLIGSKKAGLGPALGFGILFKSEFKIEEKKYRPQPNPHLVAKIRKYCHASIDTSDGLATSLYILQNLNQVGFELKYDHKIFHPLALKYCFKNNISPLMLYMGDHGDYQTLVCFPKKHLKKVQKKIGDQLIILGTVTKKLGTYILYHNQHQQLPVDQLQKVKRDYRSYKKMMESLKNYFCDL